MTLATARVFPHSPRSLLHNQTPCMGASAIRDARTHAGEFGYKKGVASDRCHCVWPYGVPMRPSCTQFAVFFEGVGLGRDVCRLMLSGWDVMCVD